MNLCAICGAELPEDQQPGQFWVGGVGRVYDVVCADGRACWRRRDQQDGVTPFEMFTAESGAWGATQTALHIA